MFNTVVNKNYNPEANAQFNRSCHKQKIPNSVKRGRRAKKGNLGIGHDKFRTDAQWSMIS